MCVCLCVCVCVVLQVLSRSVVLQVLRLLRVLGRVLGQVLGLVLVLVLVLVLGLGLRRGLLRLSLFTHPHNFLFANPGKPRSLNIYIYIYISNDTGTTPEGKKRYLPGMISERYGIHIYDVRCMWRCGTLMTLGHFLVGKK